MKQNLELLKSLFKGCEDVFVIRWERDGKGVIYLLCSRRDQFKMQLQQEITFEIENPDIRPEFEAIKNYFVNILKKKLIIAENENPLF